MVLTPSFSRGTVVDFDRDTRRYHVRNTDDEVVDIHPRNLIPDAITQAPITNPDMVPAAAGAIVMQEETNLDPLT